MLKILYWPKVQEWVEVKFGPNVQTWSKYWKRPNDLVHKCLEVYKRANGTKFEFA